MWRNMEGRATIVSNVTWYDFHIVGVCGHTKQRHAYNSVRSVALLACLYQSCKDCLDSRLQDSGLVVIGGSIIASKTGLSGVVFIYLLFLARLPNTLTMA